MSLDYLALSDEDRATVNLLSLGTAIAATETAANELADAPFDRQDAETLAGLPDVVRLPILARLIECAEALREGLRLIEAGILVARGQAITTA